MRDSRRREAEETTVEFGRHGGLGEAQLKSLPERKMQQDLPEHWWNLISHSTGYNDEF